MDERFLETIGTEGMIDACAATMFDFWLPVRLPERNDLLPSLPIETLFVSVGLYK